MPDGYRVTFVIDTCAGESARDAAAKAFRLFLHGTWPRCKVQRFVEGQPAAEPVEVDLRRQLCSCTFGDLEVGEVFLVGAGREYRKVATDRAVPSDDPESTLPMHPDSPVLRRDVR